MSSEKLKTIGVLTEIVVDDAIFANAQGNEDVILEDSQFWRITYEPVTGVFELFNYNSGTRSVIMVSADDQLEEKTFEFIPRESGPQDDDIAWERIHRRKIGI